MLSILDALGELIAKEVVTVVEKIDLPGRNQRRLELPPAFISGNSGRWLQDEHAKDGSLWRHQSLALTSIYEGRNVLVATGTASGKSLIFQASVLRLLETDPEARVIVFYPLKALAADQLVSWRQAAAGAGFASDIVGEIHGSILQDERLAAIRNGRVLIMTPDVCQAWMMRNVTMPDIRRFLGKLRLLILDEVHVLEAVFGSNVSFLLRRLQAARGFIGRDLQPLQIIAASATIANPAQHFEALTGTSCDVFGESDDGSPRYPRQLIHLASNASISETATQILQEICKNSETESFIAFSDSRQGVERIARSLDHDGIKPYRSGYETEDRVRIENALRSGLLRGVVSTSALELGINIPHFSFGLNLDVPTSKKAFRQRVGRVGRSQPGLFAVLADPLAFRRLGSTFQEYWAGSVEQSHLYLENRFMQFAHARCLSEELEGFKGNARSKLPTSVEWPPGFADIFKLGQTGGARPLEFDQINLIGGNDPHLNYPLRNVGDPSFSIVTGNSGTGKVGTVNLQQAIREAYPGAIYLHLARAYRVFEWRNTAFDRTIKVGQTSAPGITKPLIRTFVNASIDRAGIVAGHYREGPQGFLAECQLQITESVEGFQERGQKKLYTDLRQENPAMTRKIRDFRTTGVVLRVSADWFREAGAKQQLADALGSLIFREYSIAPQDVDIVATNIALIRNGQRISVPDAIVVFDATYGSLRLTESVFVELLDLLDRLSRAADLVGTEEAPVPDRILEKLKAWVKELPPISTPSELATELPEGGWLRVLKSGSRVSRRDTKGLLADIEIIEPIFASFEEDKPATLHYSYFLSNHAGPMTGKRYTPDRSIERFGEDWSEVLWNPATGEFREEEDDQGQV